MKRTLALLLGISIGAIALPGPALAAPPASPYTITVGTPVSYPYPTDTPAAPYIDKDGRFYFQQSASLYGSTQPRYWAFFSGTNFDTATRSPISDAVNPANSNDRNNDTTWRCNNSPTGREATYAPSGSGYSQKNFCVLVGVWVDPDTGHWYGLVHNEFTPQPFGDGLHYDAIDYAVSTDQGRTWTIRDHVITSPYSTSRGDTGAFPQQTYHYGNGDQRLYVDTASGYFYVYYGSRIVDKGGSWRAFYGHVARAPISAKMAPGSWQKWYDGSWSQPGVSGRESNMVPVTSGNPNGYTPPAKEYNPFNTGTASQQIAAGKMPPTSPLFVMNITYNAHLGLYLGTPQAVDQSGNAPQEIYATDDLSTQKWYRIGDTGGYRNASWYRWFLDGANKTNSMTVGRTFRLYCSIACGNSSGEHVDITITSPTPAPSPVDPSKTYRIANGSGRILAQVSGSTATTSVSSPTGSDLQAWTIRANGDGSYRIINAATGQALGVDSATTGSRAWGTRPTATAVGGGPTVGQQWFLVGEAGAFRLINRHSGLVLGMSGESGRLTETTPTRTWTNTTGNPVGGSRTGAEQTLSFTEVGDGGPPNGPIVGIGSDRCVDVPGSSTTDGTQLIIWDCHGGANQTWSLHADGTIRALGKCLDVNGGSSTDGTAVQLYTCNGSVAQRWTYDPVTQRLQAVGKCLDAYGGATGNGTKLIIWSCHSGTNQQWRAPA